MIVVLPNPSVINPPEINSSNEPVEYKTRFYDPNGNFFGKEPYPQELTGWKDDQLTPMACTRNYSPSDTGGYGAYDERAQRGVVLTDKALLSYIQTLKEKYKGHTINEVWTCAPKDQNTIIMYSLGPCGGGCSGNPYIGVINSSGNIREVGAINYTAAYFGCRQPLQLTTQGNNFYVGCGGGDGGAGSASIYRLSLNTLKLARIRYCESDPYSSKCP